MNTHRTKDQPYEYDASLERPTWQYRKVVPLESEPAFHWARIGLVIAVFNAIGLLLYEVLK